MTNVYDVFKYVIYSVFMYLGIKTGDVMILFLLMSMDSILGIVKALRLGEKFSFNKLIWGAVSKLTILIVPMILALMGKGLSFDFTYFVVAVINVIIVSEGISCITNIISIKSKKQIENSDYVTRLLASVRAGLMTIVQKLLGVIENGNNNNLKN